MTRAQDAAGSHFAKHAAGAVHPGANSKKWSSFRLCCGQKKLSNTDVTMEGMASRNRGWGSMRRTVRVLEENESAGEERGVGVDEGDG